MSGFLTALADFWRVDNKHGLYPQKDSFNFKINYSGVIYFMLTVSMLATAIFFCIRWCRMADIVFNKETVQIYRENCKEHHNPYFNRWFSAIAAKISQNFTFLCKKLVFSDSFCELYFTQPLYINYCTNYLNTFLLKIGIIKAIINIIKE